MRRSTTLTKKITFCAMLSALGALSLLITNILPTVTAFFYLFSTFFTYVATEEYGIRYGISTCVVITLLGFILVASKVDMVAYAIVITHYPIVKHIVDHKVFSKAIRWVIKLVWVSLLAVAAYFVMIQFAPFEDALWLLYVLLMAVIVLYDIVLERAIQFYAIRLRRFKF
ncbi:MAG: hypothetical protein IKW04_04880 [Clostridia bacterium]|nr:hypothetical protein [Clostridia bacterium]